MSFENMYFTNFKNFKNPLILTNFKILKIFYEFYFLFKKQNIKSNVDYRLQRSHSCFTVVMIVFYSNSLSRIRRIIVVVARSRSKVKVQGYGIKQQQQSWLVQSAWWMCTLLATSGETRISCRWQTSERRCITANAKFKKNGHVTILGVICNQFGNTWYSLPV